MKKLLKTLQNNRWVIFIFAIVDVYLFISFGLSTFDWVDILLMTSIFDSLWFGVFLSIIIYYNFLKLLIDALVIIKNG